MFLKLSIFFLFVFLQTSKLTVHIVAKL